MDAIAAVVACGKLSTDVIVSDACNYRHQAFLDPTAGTQDMDGHGQPKLFAASMRVMGNYTPMRP